MKITVKVPENSAQDSLNKIKDGFRKKYGEDTSFEIETADGIIGGFIAEVNGTVYDTSIGSKLKAIKKVITE